MSQDKSNSKIQPTAGPWEFAPVKAHKLRSRDVAYGCLGSPSIAYVSPGVGAILDGKMSGVRQLIALAPTAPHSCDVPDCPGPKNLAKLKAAEGLGMTAEKVKDMARRGVVNMQTAGAMNEFEKALTAWNDAQ